MRKIILGTDWWTDCDDAVALRLICRTIKEEKIQLLGVGINACMEYSVASLNGFLKAEGVEDIPIGIDLDAVDFGGNPPYQRRLQRHFALRSEIRMLRMPFAFTGGSWHPRREGSKSLRSAIRRLSHS